MKKLLLGLFSLSLLATACKKSKDAPAVTKENLAGSYKIVSVRVSVNGSAEQDFDLRDDCQKDDVIELIADGNYNYHDNGTVCDPAGDVSGNWSLDGNVISSDDGDLNGTVSSFDGTNMDITVTSTENNMTYKIRTTLKKQ